jgi:hypothetical protein
MADSFWAFARDCVEANENLTPADRKLLVKSVPFGQSAFSKFVMCGSNKRLQKPEVICLLPPAYTTVYAVNARGPASTSWR